jgi:hypothetical protein
LYPAKDKTKNCHRGHRELRKFTAEPAEFAEKIVFILNLSGLGVLCG